MATTTVSIEHFIEMVAAGACSTGFTLDLRGKNLRSRKITLENLQAIAEVLTSGKCPSDLTIDLYGTQIGSTVDDFGSPIKDNRVQVLINALLTGKCPPGLALNLGECVLERDTEAFAKTLSSGCCPVGFSLDFSQNKIDCQGAIHFSEALKSGNCPEGLSIKFFDNKIGLPGITAIADALVYGKCPPNLFIGLANNGVNVNGAQALATAIASGNCSYGLGINLKLNDFGAEGTKAIANAVASGNAPKGLSLAFSGWEIKDEGFQSLGVALASGKCPSGLSIKLGQTPLTQTRIFSIANALKSGKCPPKLSLLFDTGSTNFASLISIVEALASGKAPTDLTIDFGNYTMASSMAAFAKALQSGQCPKGLTLKFDDYHITTEHLDAVNGAIQFGNCPPYLVVTNQHTKPIFSNPSQRIYENHARSFFTLLCTLKRLQPNFPKDAKGMIARALFRNSPYYAKRTETGSAFVHLIGKTYPLNSIFPKNKKIEVVSELKVTDPAIEVGMNNHYPEIESVIPNALKECSRITTRIQKRLPYILFHQLRAQALLMAAEQLSLEDFADLIRHQLHFYQSTSPNPYQVTVEKLPESIRETLAFRFKRFEKNPPKGIVGYYHLLNELQEMIANVEQRSFSIT